MPSIAQLEKMLAADPRDAFILYGLAQEHAKAGGAEGHGRAVEFYDRCLEVDPAYCYAYFHKARSLMAMGRNDAAAETVRGGDRCGEKGRGRARGIGVERAAGRDRVMARRAEQSVRDTDDAGEARRLALKMLKLRMMSRGALVSRLVKRGVSPDTAGAVAAQLEALGLLNDRKLAESLVRKQMGMKAAGKRVLVAKLRQRGIGSATANEAVDEGLKGRDPLNDAIDLARRRLRTTKKGLAVQVIRQRVFAYLARRGFDAEVCRTAVERAVGKTGSWDAE